MHIIPFPRRELISPIPAPRAVRLVERRRYETQVRHKDDPLRRAAFPERPCTEGAISRTTRP